MKLLLFAPVIKSSAIGRMASLVTRELTAEGHELTVVRTETPDLLNSDAHHFGVAMIPWDDSDQVAAAAQIADAVLYQIGNNHDFHQGALHWLPNLRGIVCLHDFFLGHLFSKWAESRHPQALAILRIWYGDDNAKQFFGYQESETFIAGTRNTSPMTEWICSMAVGVITHSSWGCERVLQSCPGPVRVVPLAYDRPGVSPMVEQSLLTPNEKFQILTLGHINPNKRVESVIQAIGNSAILSRNSVYRLVGKVEPKIEMRLSALAKEHGVRLVVSGEVEDAVLRHALEECDVVCCLRWPTLEAASASTIEAMLSGKPTIVINTGFYQEIPDRCAIKINPQDEIGQLQSALELLYKDTSQRQAVAQSGQEWASKTFTPENYALEVLDFVSAVMRSRPAIDAIDYFCSVIHRWSANPEILHHDEIVNPLGIFGSSGEICRKA